MPKVAMEGMTPETLAWFAQHPNWDPRVRLAAPSQREFVQRSLALENQNLAQWQQPFASTTHARRRTD
ncbi:MAG: hypothetical protein R3C03_00890 [Pirellulaceae bacterium]